MSTGKPAPFRWLLDLLYPPKCPFCGKVLDRAAGGICPSCAACLPRVEKKEPPQRIEFCRRTLSPLWYRDRVIDGVQRYKFRGGQNHAALFSTLMAECYSAEDETPCDLVTWVPLSPKRLGERGYDQARLLAEGVAEHLSLPVRPLLEKVRETGAQSHLRDAAGRRANAKGAYRVCAPVRGRHVLLVDDVSTSGATLSECAACLLRAGALSVTALTLARARK